MSKLVQNLTFVLVRTQFASNLGSAVRSMKNMGFRKLVLVQPECEVGIEARSFAMKGADILDQAQFLPNLQAVARETGILIGTTGRFRGARPRLIDLPTLVEEVLPELAGSQVGIVFGSEDNGLRKEDLSLCQWLVEIPTAPEFPVINLAQAVAITAYQIHLSTLHLKARETPGKASPEEIDALLGRIEEMLQALRLPTRASEERLLRRLRKIAVRAQLERGDVNMIHGLLKQAARGGGPSGTESRSGAGRREAGS